MRKIKFLVRIGKTQLYKLNKDNIRVKIFLRNFEECLRLVIEENSGISPMVIAPMNVGLASAKMV